MTSKKIRHNGQDIMMNLLGESSDSGPEPLNLPPIKGKKLKRKKNYGSQEMCSMWTFAKVFLTLLFIASITTLSAISFWLVRQVDDLKIQLQTVTLASQSSLEDYQKLHSQMQEMNKTVNNLRTGKSGLDTVYKNITILSEQIQKLTEEMNKQKSGLEASPSLKELPSKYSAISKTVANLGSDLQTVKSNQIPMSFKDETQTTIQQLRTELDELKEKVMSASSPPNPTPGTTKKSPQPAVDEGHLVEIQQKITSMEDELQAVNSSLMSQISTMQTAMLEHGSRTAALENTTHNMLANITLLTSTHTGDPGEDSGVIQGELEDSVKKILDNMLKNMSTNNMSPTEAPKTSDITGLEAYRQLTDKEIQHLNESFTTLYDDFEDMVSKVSLNKNQLFIMTHQISGLQRFLATIGYTEDEKTNVSGTLAPPSQTSTLNTVEDKDNVGTTNSSLSKPVLHIQGIDTPEDLKRNFQIWDLDGDEKVTFEDLTDHRPHNQLPSREDLFQYDKDQDGFYSEKELQTALGFQSTQ